MYINLLLLDSLDVSLLNKGGRSFVVNVILEKVVRPEVVSLANALIVAIVIITWIIVGIDMTNHLGLCYVPRVCDKGIIGNIFMPSLIE
jgi:hypothetical protein